MVGHPMKYSIAKQEIGALLRHPGRKVALDKCAAWQPLARLSQHVWRRVDSDHFRIGKPFDKQFRGVTRAAAQIDDALRMIKWHLRQQIAWRACSLVFQLEVLLGAPVFGCSATLETRLTNSFKTVGDQLEQVYRG